MPTERRSRKAFLPYSVKFSTCWEAKLARDWTSSY